VARDLEELSEPVDIERFDVEADGERLAALRTSPVRSDTATALILHGAGEATKERSVPLARALARENLNAVSFDFAGHGASTGRMEDMTLRRRAAQAAAVLDTLRTSHGLVICGFSMSGQTSCDLLSLGAAPNVLVLFAPALYAARAHDLKFGPAFSAAIREPKNWRTSPARDAIRQFSGALLVYTSTEDDVVPAEVPALLVAEASKAILAEHVVLENAPHQLSEWLADNPAAAGHIAKRIARLLDSPTAAPSSREPG
jgi:uncharacterized protein